MDEPLRLGDHCFKIGSGATPRGGKDSYLTSGKYRLIRSQNIYNSGFSHDGLAYISEEQAIALDNVEVLPGDILLNITGDSVARSCQVDDSILPARVNQHVAIIRPDPEIIDRRFLRFFLISPEMQSLMLTYAGAGATRNALTKGMIENFKIPRFSIEVQREIGATLGALDDKIELNRQSNKTLEALARAFFKDWFVDFGPTRAKMEGRETYLVPDHWTLFPDRIDDETGLPEGWREVTLGDVALASGEGVAPESVPPDTPYIGLEHMPRRSIALDRWEGAGKVTSGKSAFRRGDVLFGKLRPYFHKVGIAPLDGICSTDIVVLRPQRPEYAAVLVCCVSSEAFVDYTDKTSDGTKMPRTSWSKMARYPIVLPDHDAFKALQEIVSPLLDQIIANIEESKTLSQTRDLLLPKLMRGEIRLRDAEKMVEEAL